MENQNLILGLSVVVVVVVAGIVAWAVSRQARSKRLREKFGPEYDYTMDHTGNQRAAENLLAEREKRVNHLDIHPLKAYEQEQFRTEWDEIQASFVDAPSESVQKANRLVKEVMLARGFPMADFEQRAADISVIYPDIVANYRNAHAIAVTNPDDHTSTEDLRQAMVYYRSLCQELLEDGQMVEADELQKTP